MMNALKYGSLLSALLIVSACNPITMGIGAGATVGVAAVEERGVSGAADDLRTRTSINELWFNSNSDVFREISLSVQEGRVLLTGSVEKPETRIEAVRLTWQAPGVREVMDEIQVTDISGVNDYSKDVMISTTMRKRMMFDSNIKNLNYSIEVVNGIIYLMGIAQDQKELDRVVAHARDIANVRRVVNHVILKDDPRRTGLQGER